MVIEDPTNVSRPSAPPVKKVSRNIFISVFYHPSIKKNWSRNRKSERVFCFFYFETRKEMDGSLTPVVCIIQNEFGTEWVIIEDPSEEEVGEEKKRRKSCIHQFCERIFHEEGDIYQQTVGVAGHVIFDRAQWIQVRFPFSNPTLKKRQRSCGTELPF